ncbi:MAG TPA: energy transducer TonB [Candidatus Udaeobacter sp.]|nr:energy transducer TonB [Candidatus Udaeobacter sp.]
MPFSVPQFSSRNSEDSVSWRRRVLENLRVAVSIPHSRLHPANHAAAAFSAVETSTRYGSAQTISAFTHVAILAGLFLLLASTNPKVAGLPPILLGGLKHPPRFFPPPDLKTGLPSLGTLGGGSSKDSEPARTGNLAPPSSMPLARPRLMHSERIDLPVPPAVFDQNAPSTVQIVTGLGLPWANKDTNSAGADGGDGIGNHPGDGMGVDDGNGAGAGDTSGNYANVVSQAACLHCPEPPYTDEARKAKLQGNVTLRVLIGADGRAARIQLVKGLGLGLDEQALQAVRSWRFVPARDAHRQPVPTWATIETRFQLF